MRKSLFFVAILCVAVLMFSACRKTAPIVNPTTPISTTQQLSLNDVRQAILQACPMTGWKAIKVTDNEIEARLDIRAHTAIVSIPFTKDSYSINYKSSTNLKAKNGTIHSYYNGWVENLRRNIDSKLIEFAHR